MSQLDYAPARPTQAAASEPDRDRAHRNDPDRYPTPSPTTAFHALFDSASNALFEWVGLRHVAAFASRKASVRQAVERIPERMQRVTNQARLAVELVEDFQAGTYREIGWRAIAIAAGALIYAVSPGDVVPDVIPGLGTLDDLLVTGIALRLIRRELVSYCRFKGYDPTAYFD